MEAIVMYPLPIIGHLIPMVELGKLILKHKPSFSIHIIIFDPLYTAGSTAPYINKVSATTPSIIFHHLPTVTLASSLHQESLCDVIQLNNPNLHQALISLFNSYTIFAFIVDFLCSPALSVTAKLKLNIPTYAFFVFGAAVLSLLLYFPTIHKHTSKGLKDINTLLLVPGLPPIPPKDIPHSLLDRDDKLYQYFLDCSIRWPRSAGIIVNTFEYLEPRAIRTIIDGLCVLDQPTPPIYCVGPLIAADDRKGNPTVGGGDDSKPECLAWLDSQPSQSVVYLCFGSLGQFSVDQLKEIAIGLERSEQRFLWVVRNPPSKNESWAISEQLELDLDSILPEGFLERTKERGFVVKSWAPQVAILNHDSVGGFVTHCGWNSVLEAMCAGVPMVAWPLYAEQRFNRILLVEEIKIALPMIESEKGLVSSAEVEKRVRELMGAEEGNSVRKRSLAMQNAAKATLNEGGSSSVMLSKLVDSLTRK